MGGTRPLKRRRDNRCEGPTGSRSPEDWYRRGTIRQRNPPSRRQGSSSGRRLFAAVPGCHMLGTMWFLVLVFLVPPVLVLGWLGWASYSLVAPLLPYLLALPVVLLTLPYAVVRWRGAPPRRTRQTERSETLLGTIPWRIPSRVGHPAPERLCPKSALNQFSGFGHRRNKTRTP